MNTMNSSSANDALVEEKLKVCVDHTQKIQFVLQTMCTAYTLKTFEASLLQSMAVVLRDTANELYEKSSEVKEALGIV